VPENEKEKTIKTFALASFLNDLGSDMIYPVWPLFVTNVLGASMSALGFIDGLGQAIVSISQAISGVISDKIKKRKIFVWIGYLFGSLSRIGYALSLVWWHLIPFRILDRAGKIRSSPRDAIIADISTKEDRGRNFGLLRTMDNLGAVCGIIICILFFKLLGYRRLFLLASIPSAIGAFLVFALIKEKKIERTRVFNFPSFKNLDENFKLFLFLNAIFALGTFSYSFLLIFAKKFGFKVDFIPVLYLIFTAVTSLFSLPFGKLSDKVGRKTVLIISFLLWAIVCVIFIFAQNFIGIVLAFVIYGLHKGALEPVQRTFVSELSPIEYRASSLGGFQMLVGLCAFPSSFIAGILWEKVSIFAPFYFSLFLTFFSLLSLFFVKEKKI
jgi:MFS family permease